MQSSSEQCKDKGQNCKLPINDAQGRFRCCETHGENIFLYCSPKDLTCKEYKPNLG